MTDTTETEFGGERDAAPKMGDAEIGRGGYGAKKWRLVSLRSLRLLVVLVVAAGLYATFVKTTNINRQKLAALAVNHSGVAELASKPNLAKSLDLAKATDPVLKADFKADPANTGIYEITWKKVHAPFDQVGVLVELVPSVSDAQNLQKHANNQLKQSTARAPSGSVNTFSISSIPGSMGEIAPGQPSTLSPSGGVQIAVSFRVDRAVALVLTETSQSGVKKADVVKVARAEYRLLQGAEPGFSMATTARPVGWSIVFGAGTLLVALGVLFVPELAMSLRSRRRHAKAQRAAVRARSQYMSRGRRVVKRHSAPDWVVKKRF